MSVLSDQPPMAPPAPELETRHYQFTVKCASGQWLIFECDAQSFRAARRLMDDFARTH